MFGKSKTAETILKEALAYYEGETKVQNSQKAFSLFYEAAEAGSVEALFYLGVCYENGDGVDENSDDAFFWYLEAAKQGVSDAQHNVGLFYEEGRGKVFKNFKDAARWYQAAVKQGNSSAMINLALCYAYGAGVEQNFDTAQELLRTAHELGHESGQAGLDLLDKYTSEQLGAFTSWHLKNRKIVVLHTRKG